jgi:hypothetical protein
MHLLSLSASAAALLSVAWSAQAPEPQHLLRLTLEPGTHHFRKTLVNTSNIGDQRSINTVELTMACKVTGFREHSADLEQSVSRVVQKVGTNEADEKVLYDSEKGGDAKAARGLGDIIGMPMNMRLDDRGHLTELKLPDVMAKAMSTQIFLVRCIALPDAPVAVGKSWETSAVVPIPELGDREVKAVHKLVSVTKGRATIETEFRVDGEQAQVPRGGKIDQCVGTTVLDLATGRLVESRLECLWSAGQPARPRAFRMIEKTEAIDAPVKVAPAEAKSGGKE